MRPIFEAWMKPFRDLGMTHISPNNSPGSDHDSFDAVGLPGFRFIQDEIERRAYHTNMDTFDRYVPEDLMQAAVIMASFAYHAAMRDEKLAMLLPPVNAPGNPGKSHENFLKVFRSRYLHHCRVKSGTGPLLGG